MYRKPLSLIAYFARSEVCADKLSMNKAILASGSPARRPSRYSMNLSTLTDFSNIWKCSTPYSLEIPQSNAKVGSSNLATSTAIFYFGKHHS